MSDYSKYLDFAKRLALKAGKIIKDDFQLGMSKTYKKDGSPVTDTDINVNRLVIAEISKTYPNHNVLGEEESNILNKSEPIWVCDPIDGTIPFVMGIPTFTFSLALTIDGSPIIGVVYDPILDRLFYASKGKGCYLNGQKIFVSSREDLDILATICMPFRKEFSYNGDSERYAKLIESGVRVLNIPSVTFFGALTAAGELDATVFVKDTVHDVAALAILIEEAGGVVTDLGGKAQRYDVPIRGFIGANPRLHKKILSLFE